MDHSEQVKDYMEHLPGSTKVVISGIDDWGNVNPEMLAAMAGSGFQASTIEGSVQLTSESGMGRACAGGLNVVLKTLLDSDNPRMEVVTY